MLWLRETWTQIWITLVVAAVSLALYTSVGRQLIPLIETYRPDLEQKLSAVLKQPVSIGQLKGDWRVFSPVVHLNDVQLGPAADGVHISAMEAELDVSATLFYRQPVFRHVEIEGVIAELHQLSNTEWRIGSQWLLPSLAGKAGKTPTTETSATPAETPAWLNWLSLQQAILLKDWEITSYDPENTREDLIIDQMLWRNQGDNHDLDGQVAWGREQMTNLRVMGTMEGELWPWKSQNGEVYVHLESQDWSRWIPTNLPAEIRVNRFVAGAEAWLSIRNGDLNALHLDADIPQLEIATRAEPLTLTSGHLSASGRHNGDDWHLQITPEFAEQLPFPTVTLSAVALKDQKGWQIGIPQLDMGAAREFLIRHQLLPPPFDSYIGETQGTGQASQVRISLLPGSPWKVDVRAALQEASSVAYHGIPSFTNLSGELHLQPHGGVLRLAQEDFVMHLEGVYDQPWQLQQFDGAFYWSIHPEYSQLQVRDARGRLSEDGTDGVSWPLTAEFAMAVPRSDSQHEASLSLLLGLPDAPASLKSQLIPSILDEGVRHWIDGAILAGHFSDGAFVMQGKPGSERPQNSLTTQLHLGFEDATLRYMENWPDISALRGRLLMRSPQLEVNLDEGTTLGGKLVERSGRIQLAPDNEGHVRLDVRAHLSGGADEALLYLTDTPLAEAVNHALDDWRSQGTVNAKFQLSMPLGVEGAAPDVDLDIALADTRLTVESLNLTFDNLKGRMRYSTAYGLTSEWLEGDIFGGHFSGGIESRPRPGGFDLLVGGQGEAGWAPFREWLPLFLLDPLSGKLTYETQLVVGQDGVDFRLLSDLQGTAIDLPYPLGKRADETRSLLTEIHPGKETRISMNYNDQMRSVVALAGGGLERGQVYFGNTEPFLPSDPGLEIRGRIDEPLNASDWWVTWQHMMSLLDNDSSAGGNTSPTSTAASHGPVRSVDINLAAVDAWGTPMGPTRVTAEQRWNEWNFVVDSELVKGGINMKPGNQPLVLNLDYIHMPHDGADEADAPPTVVATDSDRPMVSAADYWPENDPLADLIPADLPALDMTLAELYVGDRNYGRWQLESRPVAGGLSVRILDSDMKALKVTGDVQWLRDGDLHTTRLDTLSLSSNDVGKVQRAFRQDAIIEGKDMRSTLSLSWHGSPLAFNTRTLNGLTSVRIRDGSMAAEGTAALKAFGALNFASVARRLKLDFSDLYQSGVSFYSLKAKARIEDGLLTFTEPLALDGPGAKFLMSGSTLMTDQSLDMKMVVTFPVSSTLPVVALLAGLAPPVAASIYVTEKLIGEEIARFTSASYDVKGSWEKPELKINQAFDDDVDGKKSRSLWDRVKSIFNIFGGD